MRTVMPGQVDAREGALEKRDHAVPDIARGAGEREHAPVVRRIGSDIEQMRAGCRDGVRAAANHRLAPSFAHVRDALHPPHRAEFYHARAWDACTVALAPI